MKAPRPFLVLVIALHCVVARSTSASEAPTAAVGVEEHVGAPLPLDAVFRRSSGEAVRLRQVLGRGRPTLLVLAYNRCSMLCNLVLRRVASAARGMPARPSEDYDLVTVSIDPRETPDEAARAEAVALDRAGYAGQRERWPFLVGEQSQIDVLAKALGFRYVWDARSEQYAHPAVVFAITADGHIARYLYGLNFDAAEVGRALFGKKPATAQASLTSALTCFRFESVKSKYGSAVSRFLQIGTLAVLFAMAIGVKLFIGRRRAR
jgi:protein SCO1/2